MKKGAFRWLESQVATEWYWEFRMKEGKMKGKQSQSSYPLCVWYVYDAIIWEKEKVFKDVKVLGQAVTTLQLDTTAYTVQVTPIPAYSRCCHFCVNNILHNPVNPPEASDGSMYL